MKKLFILIAFLLSISIAFAQPIGPGGIYGGGQPLDAELAALAGLTSAAGAIPYFTGSGTATTLTIGTAGQVMVVGGSSAPSWASSLNVIIDDSAAQFKDASVATKLVKINPTSEGTATITPTGAYNLTYTLTADSTPTFPTEGTLYGTKTDSITSANLAGSLSNETGTGVAVFATSPSFTTSILPVSNADIGSATAEWGDVYLKDSAVIKGQADQSNTITSAATGWTFNLPVTIADDTNKNYIKITNNASRDATASVNEIYPEANIWKANQNGTESSIALSPTAGQVTFAGPTAARTITVPDVAFTAASICTASHDYGAAATAWTMTATESACAYIKVTNANGAVDAVVTVTPGRTYTIYNNSGQTLTFKASGKTGGTIANGKYAVYTSGDDDVYEVWEQT